jgi:dihydroflavonol-4-reductase
MILITGATGLLGSNLTRELVSSGEDVAIFCLPSDDLSAIKDISAYVEHRFGDIRDYDAVNAAMRGVSAVYHLAGLSRACNFLWKQMIDVNARGTMNVAEAAMENHVDRIVLTSSASTCGIANSREPQNETGRYCGRPVRYRYTESKLLAETTLRDYQAKGLDAVVVNPTAVIAPGGHIRLTWVALVENIRLGRILFYPAGGIGVVTRHDMVHGHIMAMKKGKAGEKYILNSMNITYRELFTVIAEVCKVRAPKLPVPVGVLLTAGFLTSAYTKLLRNPEKSFPPLQLENAKLLNHFLYFDQTKAVRDLGLPQTSLEEAVKEVLDWRLQSVRAFAACGSNT